VRFLLQWFGSDVSHLWALWIRSAALDRLLRYQPQHAWITSPPTVLRFMTPSLRPRQLFP
jgi:hypothetical protein